MGSMFARKGILRWNSKAQKAQAEGTEETERKDRHLPSCWRYKQNKPCQAQHEGQEPRFACPPFSERLSTLGQ
jgi:hypothetical protein